FFLEGAGVFDVAGLAGGTDLVPFFTRRIGIHGNEDIGGGQVPIGAGAKIVGRQSDYNIGVLDVETRDLPAASLRRQNLFAARVRLLRRYDQADRNWRDGEAECPPVDRVARG